MTTVETVAVTTERALPNPPTEHAGGAESMKNYWPTNPDGTPKGKGWPAGLAPGECMDVIGSRGDVYTMKHHLDGGGLSCTCPAWKMQPGVFPKLPGMARSCKHWKEKAGAIEMQRHVARGLAALGDDYVPKSERPEVIAEREAKRARGESDCILYKPFSKQHALSEGQEAVRMVPPEDGGFFGKESFALAFDLQGQPVEGYWMSEKLDGVRAYWDGKSTFWSRNGNKFKVPADVAAQMPLGQPLDGELWMGRGTFQQMNGFLKRKSTEADEWYTRKVKFMVFDAPFAVGNYEDRMKAARSLLGTNLFARPVAIEKVTDEKAMRERAKTIAEEGGEGLMLREPHGVYRPDRTCDLLKVVTRLHDEAVIIAYSKGSGKLKDCPAAALACRLRSGKTFTIGSGMIETERWKPPAIGTVICLAYKGLTDAGKPRQPTYKGVCQRVDVDASQFQTIDPQDAETEPPSDNEEGPSPPAATSPKRVPDVGLTVQIPVNATEEESDDEPSPILLVA